MKKPRHRGLHGQYAKRKPSLARRVGLSIGVGSRRVGSGIISAGRGTAKGVARGAAYTGRAVGRHVAHSAQSAGRIVRDAAEDTAKDVIGAIAKDIILSNIKVGGNRYAPQSRRRSPSGRYTK